MNEWQKRVHLVTKDDMRAAREQSSNIRVSLGEYFADVLCDRRSFPEIWHWIVQKDGSPDIIQWGHETTREAAEREGMTYLQSLVRTDQFRRLKGK